MNIDTGEVKMLEVNSKGEAKIKGGDGTCVKIPERLLPAITALLDGKTEGVIDLAEPSNSKIAKWAEEERKNRVDRQTLVDLNTRATVNNRHERRRTAALRRKGLLG